MAKKYIEADRLKAEIIRLRKEQPFHDDASFLAYLHGLSKIENFIDSLQQEPKWKPLPESLEALLYAIEGKWDAIKPTSYLSRRLEDLYEGLVNTFNVDESLLAELPKVASRVYTAEDIEEFRALKAKIEASMEQEMEQEQPSEDLEAEIEMEWDSFNKHLAEYDGESEKVVWLNWFSFVDIANYFYELGKQAKKEE